MLCNCRLHCKQVIVCPSGVIQAVSTSLYLQVGASALVLKLAARMHLGPVLMPREVLLLCPAVARLSHSHTFCGSAPKQGEQRSCVMI